MKRWIALLCAVALWGAAPIGTAQADASPSVTLLRAGVEENTLTLVYQLQNALPEQAITCLVTDAAGQTVLQAQQVTAGNGVGTLRLPLEQTPADFAVRLSGTAVPIAKTGICTDPSTGFTARGIGFAPGQTAGDLLATLSGLTDLTVTRLERTLSPEEGVAVGDLVHAKLPDSTDLTLPAVVLGDVNGDGAVNASDALTVLKAAVGKQILSDLALAAADVRQDGQISAVTALDLLRFAVGKITVF